MKTENNSIIDQNVKNGCTQYAALCQQLIDDGEHYLYPEVNRTRQTDWVVSISKHQDHPAKTLLARGQAESMDKACQSCVDDYHKRRKIEARKQELLQDPKVVEALQLFGCKKESNES
jgi:hypothetical protein